jgi:Helix-turn-helix domain
MSAKAAPRWVSPKAAATHLSLHSDTLRRFRRDGGGPAYVRLGTAIRYDIHELDRWMSQRVFHSRADEHARFEKEGVE